MIFKDIFVENGFPSLIAYSGADLKDSLIRRTFNLDEVFFNDEYLWTYSDMGEIIENNKEMCFVVVNEDAGNIVGYSYWLPLKTQVIENAIKKNFNLIFLDQDCLQSFSNPEVNLNLASEAFIPGWDLKRLHKIIEDIIQYSILQLAKKGTKVNFVVMDNVCQYDEFLCDKLGLDNRYETDHNSKICYTTYSPTKCYSSSKYVEELKKYYK